MFFSYLWLVLLLIAAGWVDFWCLQLALQGFLCTARCFWHVGWISLHKQVGSLWHVGQISLSGRLYFFDMFDGFLCSSMLYFFDMLEGFHVSPARCHPPRIALSLTCHKLNCGQPPKREIFLLRPFPEVLAQRCCRGLIQRWFHGHWVACLYLAKAAVQKKNIPECYVWILDFIVRIGRKTSGH